MRGFWFKEGDAVRLLTPYDATFIAALKKKVPPKCRTWDPATRSWSVTWPYDEDAVRLARAFFEAMEELRPAGRSSSPPWSSWSSPPPPSEHSADICLARVRDRYREEARLHVLPGAPLCVVQAAYRALAREHHPDLVGSGGHAEMVEINKAYEVVRGRAR